MCPCISLIRYHMQIYVLSLVQLPLLWWLKTQFFESKLVAEKISSFEMTNFQVLDTLTIYFDTRLYIFSKIRLLIQITLCRNARKQMDISKKNRFSAEKTINCFNSHREQKIRYQYVKYSSGFFASPMLPIFSSTKLELLCQSEMTS